MDLMRKVFALVFVTVFVPATAELASSESGIISINTIEGLATYVMTLEQKLNKVAQKLANVEKELEEQKETNLKQENELNVQRILIDLLRKNNENLKQSVDEKEQQKEGTEYLRDVVETTDNLTKSIVRQNVQRYSGGENQNKIRVARQEREHVAFSAYLNRNLSNLGPGQVIQYGAIVLNEGNAFNVHTGIFTVPMNGVYLFSYACEDPRNHLIYADIMVDGARKSQVLEGPSGGTYSHAMGTNVVILRLTKGQSVWVAIDAGGHDELLENQATTFSGVFLYH